jgi:hypothetical protein
MENGKQKRETYSMDMYYSKGNSKLGEESRLFPDLRGAARDERDGVGLRGLGDRESRQPEVKQSVRQSLGQAKREEGFRREEKER